MKKQRPRYYFSFRSPFSWITSRLLNERLTPEEQAQLEYIPFWEPDADTLAGVKEQGGDFLYVQMSREKHLYILQDIRRLTKSLGYSHVWPIDERPWWELPNLAYLVAQRLGKGRAFRDAVYRSRWELGENIHTMDVLRRLASEVGVDPDAVESAPNDPTTRRQAVDALVRCHQDGVFGIPFFIVGFDKYWGVDRFEPFLAAMRGTTHRFFSGGHELPRHAIEQLGGYDVDTVGGCG